MHDNPLVSISIPTYRQPKKLKIALDSALRQTYSNLEINISNNDRTNEETNVLCSEYSKMDGRIRYYAQPKNLGAMRNSHFIHGVARGEYTLGLGDDDWLDENFVEVLVGRINGDPRCSAVFADQIFYSNEYRPYSEDEVRSLINPAFPFMDNDAEQYTVRIFNVLKGNFPNNILMRTKTLKNELLNSFSEKPRFGEDFALFSAIAFLGSICRAPGTHFHKLHDVNGKTFDFYKRLFDVSDIKEENRDKLCHTTVIDSIANDRFFVQRISRHERMELIIDLLNALAYEKIRSGIREDFFYKRPKEKTDCTSYERVDRFFEEVHSEETETVEFKDLFRLLWRHPLVFFKKRCSFLFSKKIMM